MPAPAQMTPESVYSRSFMRFTRIPEKKAVSLLRPMAYKDRPNGVA